jgi:hypothetical protein
MNPPQANRWRTLRCWLTGFAVCLTVVGLFYTEENWRGKTAWENCKRTLEAQGCDFKWADSIPEEVPDDQNVFGVPEMQRWFNGRGATELSKKIAYPGTIRVDETNALADGRNTRLVVADLKIQLPGDTSDSGSNVLQWGDSYAPEQAAKLIKDALGPVALHPGSGNLLFTPRSLDDIRPAQILLSCQTAPTTNDLSRFLPKVSAFTDTTDADQLQLEPENGGYKVTMLTPDTTAEFLKWNEQFEPEFALIRNALQRPLVRMKANYNTPETVAIPNFVTSRIFVQSMAAMTECQLLQGNPDAALDDLTRMHEICHIFTNRPITLVGAMINVAVRGLYVDTIAYGLRRQCWREPQLAALEEQLKTIDVIAPLHQSLHEEPVSACESLQSTPPARLFQLFFTDSATTDWWDDFTLRWAARLVPHGWIYQNMVVTAQRAHEVDTWLDPVNETVFPRQVDADRATLASLSHGSPYSFIAVAFIPNNVKACQRAAVSQTKVHQAIIACALLRYHLAHGEYPETLNTLAPRYLSEIPGDVIGSQPPHYRRTADGTFVLYSVGWSGRDGGGVPGKSIEEGDWVWPEPNLL